MAFQQEKIVESGMILQELESDMETVEKHLFEMNAPGVTEEPFRRKRKEIDADVLPQEAKGVRGHFATLTQTIQELVNGWIEAKRVANRAKPV